MDSPSTHKSVRAVLVLPMGQEIQGIPHLFLAEKMEKYGKGLLNGWGGKIKPGESILEAVNREFTKETGGARINPDSLHYRGLIDVHYQSSDGTSVIFHVYIFVVEKIYGTIKKTEEMGQPFPFPVCKFVANKCLCTLPFKRMMPGDKSFFPRILSGERIAGKIVYEIDEYYRATLIGEPIIVSAPYLTVGALAP